MLYGINLYTIKYKFMYFGNTWLVFPFDQICCGHKLYRSSGAARALGFPSRTCSRWQMRILLRLLGAEGGLESQPCLRVHVRWHDGWRRLFKEQQHRWSPQERPSKSCSAVLQPVVAAKLPSMPCIYLFTYIQTDWYILLIREIATHYKDETQSDWHNY